MYIKVKVECFSCIVENKLPFLEQKEKGYEENYISKKFHQEPWTSKLRLPNLVAVLSQKKKDQKQKMSPDVYPENCSYFTVTVTRHKMTLKFYTDNIAMQVSSKCL